MIGDIESLRKKRQELIYDIAWSVLTRRYQEVHTQSRSSSVERAILALDRDEGYRDLEREIEKLEAHRVEAV